MSDTPEPARSAAPPASVAPFPKSLTRKLQPLWKPHYLARIGILHQHPPRPWRIPSRYYRAAIPVHPPMIGIVTPSFNQAAFLERTIRSVFDQRYPGLQYVVMDGGSQDGSARIIERFADQLVHWQSGPDGGQASAINQGFAHIDAPIMAYLNSDDVLLPGALATVAGYFMRHPDVDVVYGHRVVIDEQDREIGRWVLPPHDDELLCWADYVPQETLFWRRALWDRVGGKLDEAMRFAMDWELLLRFREAGARMAVVPRFLGAFRAHGDQKTSAEWDRFGQHEMDQLRLRTIGRVPKRAELKRAIRPYLRRHVLRHYLWRLGLVRY